MTDLLTARPIPSGTTGETLTETTAAFARRRRRLQPSFVAGGLVVAGVVGAVAGLSPILALVLAAAGLVGMCVLTRPDLATIAVAGLIYSNAAVVAVRVHGAPESIQYLVPLLLALPLADRVLRRREAPVASQVLPLAIAFLAVQIVSALLSRQPALAMESVRTSAMEGIALLALIPNALGTRAALRKCLWAVVLIGAALGALSLVQTVAGLHDQDFLGFAQAGEEPPPVAADDVFAADPVRRLGGPIGEKNRYAQVLLLAAPIALVLARREANRSVRTIAAMSLLLVLAGVILTFSRGAALGVAVLAVLAVVLGEFRLKHLVVAVVGVAVLLVAVPQYRERLSSISALSTATDRSVNRDETDGSIRSRVTENLAAVGVFADHPVLGVGPDQFPSYYSDYAERVGIRVKNADREAHNLYLDLAADLGILGLGAFLALNAATLRALVRARRRAIHDPMAHGMATALLLALVSYLVTGLFLHFSFVRYYWLVVAFAAAAILVIRDDGIDAPAPDAA